MLFKTSHFDKAFKLTIGHEGGYVDDPNDRGGETKYGITKRQYPNIDIKNLTLKEAKEIYKRDYYDEKYDNFSKDIAIELFDTGVNMGVYTAKKFLQEALNLLNRNGKNFDDLEVDGIIGLKTLEAYKKVDPKKLLKVLNGLQLQRYMTIAINDKTQEKFINGWLNRV